MARYEDLTVKELRAKAEEQGIEDAKTLTREQLVAELSKEDPEASDPDALGKKSDFVTPVLRQDEQTMGADEEKRELSGTGSEQAPAEGEEADQTSLGGTGGTTTTNSTGGTGFTGEGGVQAP